MSRPLPSQARSYLDYLRLAAALRNVSWVDAKAPAVVFEAEFIAIGRNMPTPPQHRSCANRGQQQGFAEIHDAFEMADTTITVKRRADTPWLSGSPQTSLTSGAARMPWRSAAGRNSAGPLHGLPRRASGQTPRKSVRRRGRPVRHSSARLRRDAGIVFARESICASPKGVRTTSHPVNCR